MSKVKYQRLSKQGWDYVWDKMRHFDAMELSAMGVKKDHFPLFHDQVNAFQARHAGKPFAVWGAIDSQPDSEGLAGVLHLWFFATDEVADLKKHIEDGVWLTIKLLREQNLGKPIYITVWNENKVTMRWLKQFGFVARKFKIETDNFTTMELM